MTLTKDFTETVRARALREAGFRRELLREAIETLITGDVDTGKILLRDYINATIGFARLAAVTHLPAKSLMRMVGPHGNPQARNLFDVIAHLQRAEGVTVQVSMRKKARRAA
mgnify:CR=1 FL=1